MLWREILMLKTIVGASALSTDKEIISYATMDLEFDPGSERGHV